MSSDKNSLRIAVVVVAAIVVVTAVYFMWPGGRDGTVGRKISEATELQSAGKLPEAIAIWKELEKLPSLTKEQRETVASKLALAQKQQEAKQKEERWAAELERINGLLQAGKWDEVIPALKAVKENGGLSPEQQATIDEKLNLAQKKQRVEQQFAQIAESSGAGNWKEAADAGEILIRSPDLSSEQKRTAEENVKLARQMEQNAAEDALKGKLERPIDENSKRPESEIPSQNDFLKHYQKNRKVRSFAVLNTSGRGIMRQFVLKGTAHFAAQVRVVLETEVLENKDDIATFRVEFREVSQEMAVSEFESIRLEWPKEGLLATAWTVIEEHILEEIPFYRKVRWAGGLLDGFDPNFEGILTTFVRQLRDSAGVELFESPKPLQLLRRVEDLQGQKLEIEYVRDFGITKITVLNGRKLPLRTLEDLASRSSLLMDHYLFPNIDEPAGSEWTVEADEVAGLLGAGYRANAAGELVVRREEDIEKGKLARLVLKEGTNIFLDFEEAEKTVKVGLEPLTGADHKNEIQYSLQDFLIHKAMLEWKLDVKNIPKYFLFEGTSELEDVHCRSYYEAKLVPATPAASKP